MEPLKLFKKIVLEEELRRLEEELYSENLGKKISEFQGILDIRKKHFMNELYMALDVGIAGLVGEHSGDDIVAYSVAGKKLEGLNLYAPNNERIWKEKP